MIIVCDFCVWMGTILCVVVDNVFCLANDGLPLDGLNYVHIYIVCLFNQHY